jgi:hypothetical protein
MRMTDREILTAHKAMQSGKSLQSWRRQTTPRLLCLCSSDLAVTMRRTPIAHHTVVCGTDFRLRQRIAARTCGAAEGQHTPPPRPRCYGDSEVRENRSVVTD